MEGDVPDGFGDERRCAPKWTRYATGWPARSRRSVISWACSGHLRRGRPRAGRRRWSGPHRSRSGCRCGPTAGSRPLRSNRVLPSPPGPSATRNTRMRPSRGAAPPARGRSVTLPVSARASLLAPRFAAFSSLLPAGLDAFVPAGMEAIVSSQPRRDGRAAAGGWLSRLAARRLVGGKRRRGVHPQRGDCVLAAKLSASVTCTAPRSEASRWPTATPTPYSGRAPRSARPTGPA